MHAIPQRNFPVEDLVPNPLSRLPGATPLAVLRQHGTQLLLALLPVVTLLLLLLPLPSQPWYRPGEVLAPNPEPWLSLVQLV